MGKSKSAPAMVRHAERKIKALELRASGATYEQIARRLGVSKPHAWRLVDNALGELNKKASEQAERLRTLENARLDCLQQAVWAEATRGQPSAVRLALQIAERRAKLNGIDLGGSGGVNIALDFDTDNPPVVELIPDSGPLVPR